jgi:hypothetical protein
VFLAGIDILAVLFVVDKFLLAREFFLKKGRNMRIVCRIVKNVFITYPVVSTYSAMFPSSIGGPQY